METPQLRTVSESKNRILSLTSRLWLWHAICALTCIRILTPASAADAYFKFDGDLVDSSGNGYNGAMFTGAWQFVALVYDTRNRIYRIHWGNNRSEEKTYEKQPNPPGQAIWVGASSEGIRSALEGVVIDELRITNRALSAEEIAQLRDSANQSSAVSTSPATPTTQSVTDTEPDSDAQATTGIFGVAHQDPTNINSNLDPKFIEGRTTSLIGIAGRWQGEGVIGTGQNYLEFALQVDFYGPDSDLSGHIWTTQSGAPDITSINAFSSGSGVQANTTDEPLTSVSKTGNIISFAAPSVGDISGDLSEDGITITSERDDFVEPLTLRKNRI